MNGPHPLAIALLPLALAWGWSLAKATPSPAAGETLSGVLLDDDWTLLEGTIEFGSFVDPSQIGTVQADSDDGSVTDNLEVGHYGVHSASEEGAREL